MSKLIALVTYNKQQKLTPDDQMLVKPLYESGYDVVAVPWDKRGVDWEEYDTVILRSCWDYHLRFEEFSRWLDELEKRKVQVWNPIPVIRWNADKKYLFDLQKQGVNVVPSRIIEQGENNGLSFRAKSRNLPTFGMWKIPPRATLGRDDNRTLQKGSNLEEILHKNNWDEAVVKPTIGASAYEVFNINEKDAIKKQRQLDKLLVKSDVLVQKFIKEVKREGEWSLVFFGKKFSHAVLLKPIKNDFRVYKGIKADVERKNPPPILIREAEKIIKLVKSPLLYARVDMVMVEGKPLLMELELIEPQLFFDEKSAGRFARVFAELKRNSEG